VDHQFARDQGKHVFEGLAQAHKQVGGCSAPQISILIAEDPSTTVKAARRLKKGESVLLYLDGNTGVGGVKTNQKNMTPIKFLGTEISARTGAAFLSYLTQKPLIPILGTRSDWLSRDFNVCDPIVPAQGMDRKTYCRQSTENLSNHLEQTVRKFPTQWEAWLYLHNFQPNTHHVGKP
jgi:lauroyl/myristoyl acyltransferase